jgi:Two component regulator propeller
MPDQLVNNKWGDRSRAAASAGSYPRAGQEYTGAGCGLLLEIAERTAARQDQALCAGRRRRPHDLVLPGMARRHGRLDPATGKVVEYPVPYTDNGMRDLFLDKDGRIWFGTPPNNRVGYFYLASSSARPTPTDAAVERAAVRSYLQAGPQATACRRANKPGRDPVARRDANRVVRFYLSAGCE